MCYSGERYKAIMAVLFVQASIYPYNLHMPRFMILKLGMGIHRSKLMIKEFGVSRSKVKVSVTFCTETVHG